MRGFLFLFPVLAVAAETFPDPVNSEKVAGEPMPAAEAAATLEVPEGFQVRLFAAEPEVRNPIAGSWDARGRLWIAENYTYERVGKQLDTRHRDRVVIFDDTNHDGVADARKVFTDELIGLTSIEWGMDGLWALCPPRLLFLPDRNRDDVPDGPAEVVLDGFTVPGANHHNFANGLRWGPDGWLYGRCGASAPGEVGPPGTPDDHRVPMRGGMWRYHPTRRVFEALNHGTTNPWGHDWDRHGELFFINTVNGHLWHALTGAHFVRPHTIDSNPYVYELMDMHADHWHFDTTGDWTKSRDGAANAFGGGHAHVGMIIYQGTNWPEAYRNQLYTINLHGRRTNREVLEPRGSGYVGRHGTDLLFSKDPFFRGIELLPGPDGAVYLLDWSDTGECHEDSGVHRSSGRIFKITFGDRHAAAPDFASMTPPELAVQVVAEDAWTSRMARQVLAAHPDRLQATAALQQTLGSDHPAPQRLSALWALHQLDALSREGLESLLQDRDPHLRAWAIRLLTDRLPLDTIDSQRHDSPEQRAEAATLAPLLTSAAADDTASVRLAVACALQRLPASLRAAPARILASHAEDAADHNLPLMIWYGLIPVAEQQPDDLVTVASACELPLVRRFIARRLAEDITTRPEPVNALLQGASNKSLEHKLDLLRGVLEAFEGRHKAPRPASWESFTASLDGSGDSPARPLLLELEVLFGDGRALAEIRKIVSDGGAPLGVRKNALRTLIDQQPDDLRALCEGLLKTRFLNTVALQGLIRFDDPAVAERILDHFGSFHPSEHREVVDALVTRPAFAKVLLDRIAAGKFRASTLTPYHARQIRNLGDEALTAKLTAVWGSLNDSPAAKTAFIAALKEALTPAALAEADLSHGRTLYEAACASCHLLYGQGGQIGPDLTGGGRSDLSYLLDNIVTPSAVVTSDFRLAVVKRSDGSVLTGMIRSQDDRKLVLQTLTAEETIPADQLSEVTRLEASLMPDGLLEALDATQRRDLLAYLLHPVQVRPAE